MRPPLEPALASRNRAWNALYYRRQRGKNYSRVCSLDAPAFVPIMEPIWNHLAAMPNLSIKNVPELVVEKLRARAAANHRSLQGELMALVCQATNDLESAGESAMQPAAESGWKSVEKILAEHKAARPRTVTKGPRAVDIVRGDRDTR